MGTLSNDELFISPLSSLILIAIMLVMLEVGSRYFKWKQELPSLDWRVLEQFRGSLFDVRVRRELLRPVFGLGGLRSLHALSDDEDPSLQSRSASSIAALHDLATSNLRRS